MATRNLAIMFTDIQGFTARTSESTRLGIENLIDTHERVLKPVFATFRGTVIKTIGDAFLVTFESPTDAVICGLTIQEVLRQRNARVTEPERLNVRVAINAGDVELRPDPKSGAIDVFGEAVNLAARLEGITEAGEVWFTEAVYLTMNRAEAPSSEIGERTFKGIPNPVRVYRVSYQPGSEQAMALAAQVKYQDDAEPSIPERVSVVSWRTRRRAQMRRGMAGAVLLALGAAGGIVLWNAKPSTAKRIAEARALVIDHQEGKALEVLGVGEAATTPEGKELANQALLHELTARIKAEEEPNETARWMDDLVKRHPVYKPLVEEDLPAARTTALVNDLLTHDTELGEDDFWKPLRDMIQRFPKSNDTYGAAADAIEASGKFQSDAPLWLYRESFKRGHTPNPKVFEYCADAFASDYPDSDFTKEAEELATHYFPAQMKGWSLKQASTGTKPYPFLNATAYLRSISDPLASREDVVALENLILGKDMPEAARRLNSLKDPERQRAEAMLKEAADNFSFRKSNRLEVVAAANTLAGSEVVKP